MAHAGRRSMAGHKAMLVARGLYPPRRRGAGLAVLIGRPASQPWHPPVDPGWMCAVLPVARVALWALPLYAASYLWWTLTDTPDPAAEPSLWADRITSAGYQVAQLAAGVGGGLVGVVAFAALGALLWGMRGRWLALAGALTGLAAIVVLLPRLGLTTATARTLAQTVQDGGWAAGRWYSEVEANAATTVVAGLVLLSVSWLLLGLAVWRSGLLSRGDGVLLMITSPLVGVAGLVMPVLVPLGAMLLVAAGLGLAWTAGRLAAQVERPGNRPGRPAVAPAEAPDNRAERPGTPAVAEPGQAYDETATG